MEAGTRLIRYGCIIVGLFVILSGSTRAATVSVRFREGFSHGFVRVRDPQGRILADGETSQRPRGNRIVARLRFAFRDGSVYDETTSFTQQREFRLVTEHVVQHGPAFPESQDLLIDAPSGQVTVHYTEKGEAKTASEHLDLPPDIANGIVQTLLKNEPSGVVPESLPYVIATPKPRLVKLLVSIAGTDRFSVGRLRRPATHYVLKVDAGAIAGAIAPLIGKQPPDSHIWILHDDVPMFVRAQMPFFSDAPLWTIELASAQLAPARSSPGR